MQITYEKLQKNITSNQISPCYFFYGDEDYLIEDLLQKLLKKLIEKETAEFNLDIVYGNEVDGGKITSLANSYPMMAERRVVIVKDADRLSQQSIVIVAKYTTNPSPSTCLVLIATNADFRKKGYAIIKQNTVCFESKPFYENKIPPWIKNFVGSKGYSISQEAIHLLQISVGTSLRNLAGEIDKVLLNLKDRTKIEVSDIETVVGISKNYNTFELCDAIGRRDISASLKILSQMIPSGESPTAMVAMLTRHFTILAKLQSLLNRQLPREKMASIVGLHPYFITNYIQQAREYRPEEVYQAFEFLLDADIKLKSSNQKPGIVMELLLFNIIKNKN